MLYRDQTKLSSKLHPKVPAIEHLEQRCLFTATFPIQIHKLPKGTNFPGNLTLALNGNVWFTCGLSPEVGFISPANRIKIFSTKSASSHGLDSLTVGPDGNIWFAELFDNVIGEVTVKGVVTTYKVPNTYGPQSITLGPDGHLWLSAFDNYVGRVNSVANGQADVTWFSHTGENVHKIISFNGSLYVQEGDTIGQVSTSGVFSSETILPSGGSVQDLCVGPDGNLWFTENRKSSTDANNFVGYLTPQGTVVENPVASKIGDLSGITAGDKRRIYFRDGDSLEDMSLQGKIVASRKLGFIAGGGSVVENAKRRVWCAEGVLDKLVLAIV